MMETYSEVSQNSVNFVHPVESHEVFDESEIGMHKRETIVVDSVGIGVHVAVERIKMTFFAESLHYGARMAAPTEGCVNIDSLWLDLQ